MTMPDILVESWQPSGLSEMTVCSTCISTGVDMRVSVGTTGHFGGDSGCDTYLRFDNLNGNLSFKGPEDKTVRDSFTITAQGDMELDALMESLRFALQMLEIQKETLRNNDAERERNLRLQGD